MDMVDVGWLTGCEKMVQLTRSLKVIQRLEQSGSHRVQKVLESGNGGIVKIQTLTAGPVPLLL